jgi:ATP-dependent RNA helicase DHX33
LGAIDNKQHITALGRNMAALPLDPAFARVLLASFDNGCPREIIDLVSMVGEVDKLFINSAAARERAGESRKKFWHREGDHMMLLNVLKAYEETPDKDKSDWCQQHFFAKRSFVHALEARKQLRQRCDRLGLKWDVSCGEETEPILTTLLLGLYENAALRQLDGTYRNVQTRMVRFATQLIFFI